MIKIEHLEKVRYHLMTLTRFGKNYLIHDSSDLVGLPNQLLIYIMFNFYLWTTIVANQTHVTSNHLRKAVNCRYLVAN